MEDIEKRIQAYELIKMLRSRIAELDKILDQINHSERVLRLHTVDDFSDEKLRVKESLRAYRKAVSKLWTKAHEEINKEQIIADNRVATSADHSQGTNAEA